MLALVAHLAFAQEEACTPVPEAELLARFDAIEAAVAVPDLARAQQEAEAARDDARCLAVPITPELLARLAWDRAEVAAFAMEEELAWQWIRLARVTGSNEPPDRVPATSPLRDLLTEPADNPPVTGPSGVVLNPPRKGTIYADGRVLDKPELQLSTPHLLQAFVGETLVQGSWVMGANFPSALLLAEVHEGEHVRSTGDALPPKGWKPAKVNTETAYKDWLKKHPDGPWMQDALDGIDDLQWAAFDATGTDLAYRQYLHDHPEGLHVDEARFRIEHLGYLAVMAAPSRQAWEDFLEKAPPDGVYANEARVQLDHFDWTDARTRNTSAAYRGYREAHPDGRYASRAAELEEERAIDEARAKSTDSALRDFLDLYPDGRFADEARAILGEVKFDTTEVVIEGDVDAAVASKVRSMLLAELEKRKLPVATKAGPATAKLVVRLGVVPGAKNTDIRADLALEFGELERPLLTLLIESKMLPGDDAGQLLGTMLVENLGKFDRWRKTPP